MNICKTDKECTVQLYNPHNRQSSDHNSRHYMFIHEAQKMQSIKPYIYIFNTYLARTYTEPHESDQEET